MPEQSCSNCLEECKVPDEKVSTGIENRCLYYRDGRFSAYMAARLSFEVDRAKDSGFLLRRE